MWLQNIYFLIRQLFLNVFIEYLTKKNKSSNVSAPKGTEN